MLPPRQSRNGRPACPTMVCTTDNPRGARFPGKMAAPTKATLASPGTSSSSAAAEIAGTLLAPEMTATPAACALASSAAMPATKALSSARSM